MKINEIELRNIVIIVLAIIIVIIFAVASDSISKHRQIYDIACADRIEYVVRSGDTVDSIASEHNESNLSSHYFGKVIIDINDIDSKIYPGDIIYIPDINGDGEI